MLKETPLIEEHRRQGAKLIPFHGWKLPLEYSGGSKEHLNVRKNVGLFDVSHMGEIRVTGPGALKLLEKCLTNNVRALKKNKTQYNFLCNDQGGVVDDLILYCLREAEDYLLCVNASRLQVDFNWLKKQASEEEELFLKDESEQWAQLALQGPRSQVLLAEVLGFKDLPQRNSFQELEFLREPILVSGTGYTGEEGFEILLAPQIASSLWKKILGQGKDQGCLPVGLAARDTLRMEMKYPLYGQDLNETRDPHSAGLSWAIKNPTNFVGSEALARLKNKSQKKWVGFRLKEPMGVPRSGSRILAQDRLVGEVTSGAWSPVLKGIIGLGYVEFKYSAPSTQIQVEIHQNPCPAEIVATPFIKK